jgi:rhodanese-related sulfurtransferase
MKKITPEEVKQRLDAGEKLFLLDVRQPEETAEFNIGGKALPLPQIQHYDLDDIEDWKDKEVICYCRSGNRSGQAALILTQAGFANAKNLEGGMLAWREKFS